jgi:hypothetical protein
MKIKNFMEQGAFSEMPPEQWSGEYVSDYLTQLRDVITEVMTDTEVGKIIDEDSEKIQSMISTMSEVLGLMIDLVSIVPYSTLREVKLVNKQKMLLFDGAISDVKHVSEVQHETTRMLDERISELNKALEKMNAR